MARKANMNLKKKLIIKMSSIIKYYQFDKVVTKKYAELKSRFIHKSEIRNYIVILISLIILNLFNQILSNEIIKKVNGNVSNITLKIKGRGYKNILTSSRWFTRDNYPKNIIINSIIQETVKYEYEFKEEENYVELIWDDNNINSCDCMFRDCVDITEINFTNFDTSNVLIMNCMFNGCKSLT